MFAHRIIASDRNDERQDFYNYISDASKDAWGFRDRSSDVLYMSLAELRERADYWSEQVAISIREDEARYVAAIAEFEAGVRAAIEAGAGDRATAVRWLREAFAAEQGEDTQFARDRQYFNWSHGLPYDYDPDTGLRGREHYQQR